MLKRFVITAAVLGTAVSVFAQGTVNFDTRLVDVTQGGMNDTKIYLPGRTAPAAGTGFWAQLYAANGTTGNETQLTPAGLPVNLRGGLSAGWVMITGTTADGRVVDPVVAVTTVNGGPVTLQLRAWQGGIGSTWDSASVKGASPLLVLPVTGNPNGTPPTTPVDLVGLTGFELVPEPSTIALSILGGLGALVLIRRRK